MKLFFVLIITFSGSLVTELPTGSYFVVWNVGQGQWATAIDPLHCYHFDMGGEFFPIQKIQKQCGNKENFIFLSHWDWDHIGGLKKLNKNVFAVSPCIAIKPHTKTSKNKETLVKQWPACDEKKWKKIVDVWTSHLSQSSNESSSVFGFQNLLIPGDSPLSQEAHWQSKPWVTRKKVLLLGHHGSNTSTSEDLLTALPQVHMSISSARWARYHHPHSEVEMRLRKAAIALLRTEDWGHIWIETNH